jgi:prepilin-type N-terminal cleavage/methylation domain-containing protein
VKTAEKGFTLVELLVGLSIAAFVVGAASMTTITMMRLTPQNNDWAVALHQVQNASHWISHDVQTSQGDITVGTWPSATFLTMTVPEWDSGGGAVVDKTFVYEFEDMSGGLKRMMRNNQTDGQEIMIAEYVSNAVANYDSGTLTFTITTSSGSVEVSKDYEATQRVPAPEPPP